MSFFKRVGSSWDCFLTAIDLLLKAPILALPFFLTWAWVAVVILLDRYLWDLDFGHNPIEIMLIIFAFTMSITVSSMFLLEVVQQLETGPSRNYVSAMGHVLIKIPVVLPITIIWTFVLLVILLLQASRKNKDEEPSMEDAARTLAGLNTPFSLYRLGLDYMRKAIRLIVFLALPSVMWKNKGPFQALGDSFKIIKTHTTEFMASYGISEAAGMVMVIPLIPIFLMAEAGVEFSNGFWLLVILYEGFCWSFSIYLEQMMVAILHLWHLRWVHSGSTGPLSDIPKPDIFDAVYEFRKETHLSYRRQARYNRYMREKHQVKENKNNLKPKLGSGVIKDSPRYRYIGPSINSKKQSSETLSPKLKFSKALMEIFIERPKGSGEKGCPECFKDMLETDIEGHEIDVCISCRGVFLDNGELFNILGDAEGNFREDKKTRGSRYRCPSCQSEMVQTVFGQGGNLILDRCHNCNGTYLENGELKRAFG